MTLQDQIKSRAEQLFSLPEDSYGLARMEADRDKTTWIKGAESMMPVMKDVVNKYIAWLDFSCHIHRDIVHFIGESTGLDTYTFFIDNIYKP